MIFLTVGTQFPFDRLVKAVDELCGRGLVFDEVYAQIGDSDYLPRNFEYVQNLKKAQYSELLERAQYVISHAGMGTISQAIDLGKPMLVLPRLKRYGEVVNDHQAAIAREFQAAGHLLAVDNETELADGIEKLRHFTPKKRVSQATAVAARIAEFLVVHSS